MVWIGLNLVAGGANGGMFVTADTTEKCQEAPVQQSVEFVWMLLLHFTYLVSGDLGHAYLVK